MVTIDHIGRWDTQQKIQGKYKDKCNNKNKGANKYTPKGNETVGAGKKASMGYSGMPKALNKRSSNSVRKEASE